MLADEIEALQKKLKIALRDAKEDKHALEELQQQCIKDSETHAFEVTGLKAKMESEKKNAANQLDLLKKQLKQIEQETESMNQEKGIQSRWITEQKATLEQELNDLEDERESLLDSLEKMEIKLSSGGNQAEELQKRIDSLQV